MMYSNKFVMCVLQRGKPQKELSNGVVKLPFNCEYSLRFRNKNDRRAVVKIYIDGENVSGGGYVIRAHDYIDIKRHHDKDRAFKFVSLDSPEALDHGKDGPNYDKLKGTIEARFSLERERPQVIYRDVHHDHHHHHHHDHHYPRPLPIPTFPPYVPPRPQPYWSSNEGLYRGGDSPDGTKFTCDAGDQTKGGMSSNCSLGGGTTSSLGDMTPLKSRDAVSSFSPDQELQDGATVEGYSTGQSFYSTSMNCEEAETVLKLFLQGYEGEEAVEEVEEVVERPERPRRKPAKDNVIDGLESENDELRRKIAEMENEKLKAELEALK